jgi:hypothetical protein
MLLDVSNSLLELGVRPRAVTTPARVHGQSGTWSKTSTCENLHPDLRSMPAQTANSLRGAKKNHYFSTVRIPRLRECMSFLVRCFVTIIKADSVTSRRTNLQHVARTRTSLVLRHGDKEHRAHPPLPSRAEHQPHPWGLKVISVWSPTRVRTRTDAEHQAQRRTLPVSRH